MVISLRPGMEKSRDELLQKLVEIQYERNDINFTRNKFRVRGDVVDVYPPYAEHPLRFEFFGDEVELIAEIDEVTGEMLREYEAIPVWPASHYVTEKPKVKAALKSISEECEKRVAELKATDKLLEAQRLQQRDLLGFLWHIQRVQNPRHGLFHRGLAPLFLRHVDGSSHNKSESC